jgi:hypothetical protein
MSIDPIDYGRLVEKVDKLEADMSRVNGKLDKILERVNEARGAKWAFGVVIAALASGVTHTLHKLFP